RMARLPGLRAGGSAVTRTHGPCEPAPASPWRSEPLILRPRRTSDLLPGASVASRLRASGSRRAGRGVSLFHPFTTPTSSVDCAPLMHSNIRPTLNSRLHPQAMPSCVLSVRYRGDGPARAPLACALGLNVDLTE